VRLLLDTHTVLWWALDDRRLGGEARRAIADTAEAYVSAASIWEMAIKIGLGKLKLVRFETTELPKLAERLGFLDLAITADHAALVATLPGHHADPFDRLLIAQATLENLVVVTADRQFAKYGVPLVGAG
jgi:PIN domain nuclease of toxin-antitoxin system